MNRYILFFGLAITFVYGCKNPDNSCATNFDQTAFLTNIANNIITPRYDSLKLQVDVLSLAISDFTA